MITIQHRFILLLFETYSKNIDLLDDEEKNINEHILDIEIE